MNRLLITLEKSSIVSCKFKVLKSNLQIQYLAVPLAGMVAEKLNLAKKLTVSQKCCFEKWTLLKISWLSS